MQRYEPPRQNTRWNEHARITGGALRNWFIAQSYDAAAVGALWFIGCLILRVPFALVWGIVGGAMQFIPNVGAIFALVGPILAVSGREIFSDEPRWEPILYVFILYAIIVVIDGLFLQPYLMKRTAKVPIWASITVPIVAGILLPFWGILLAAPALAIYYTYKNKRKQELQPTVPPAPIGDPPVPPQGQ